MSTRLETARLVIRTFEARDRDAWVAMFNDPTVTRFLPGVVATLETFYAALEARRAMETELGYAMWARREIDGHVHRAMRAAPGRNDGSHRR